MSCCGYANGWGKHWHKTWSMPKRYNLRWQVRQCPTCGREMRLKGAKPKSVETRAGSVKAQRDYYHCPICEQGAFPPRMHCSPSVNRIGASRSRNKPSTCTVTWRMISRNKYYIRLANWQFLIRALPRFKQKEMPRSASLFLLIAKYLTDLYCDAPHSGQNLAPVAIGLLHDLQVDVVTAGLTSGVLTSSVKD